MQIYHLVLFFTIFVVMKKAAGVILNIGTDLVGDSDYKEFLNHITCDISGLYIGDQTLECKYYDEETGALYLHFPKPIPKDSLIGFFEESEIINELSTIVQEG
jgi:hypothetical protein